MQKWRNIYGNLKGNADTATKAGGITSPGTTTQFWRGDNTWSNILKINFIALPKQSGGRFSDRRNIVFSLFPLL